MTSQQHGGGKEAAATTSQPSPRPPLCPEGTIIKGRWKIGQQIGQGAFGEIYVAKNLATEGQVAIKVEQVDEKKQALRAEVAILRKLQGCPFVCQFISCGRQDDINFLVMELLGENLSDLRKRQPRCVFSLQTVCRLAIEMVGAVQALHELGVLHRDVKPSNFVLGRRPEVSRRLFVIDFGLSRKFVGVEGEIKPPRANAGFRGTARYASVNSHACRELAPRDDLWSILYILVEFATGTLPWRQLRDRDKVGEVKNQYMSGRRLVDGLPPEFEDFMNHLCTLEYYSRPNYRYLCDLFRNLLSRISPASGALLFDWEKAPPSVAPAVSSVAASALAPATTSPSKIDFPWPLFRRSVTKPHKVPVGSTAIHTGVPEDEGAATGPAEGTTDAIPPVHLGVATPAVSAVPAVEPGKGSACPSPDVLPQTTPAVGATLPQIGVHTGGGGAPTTASDPPAASDPKPPVANPTTGTGTGISTTGQRDRDEKKRCCRCTIL